MRTAPGLAHEDGRARGCRDGRAPRRQLRGRGAELPDASGRRLNPGGVGDIVARFVADRLTGVIGQPVNVVNRPGSSGTVGVQSVVRAAADGYTLLAGQTTEIVVNRSLAGDVGHEPETHLKPVALLAVLPLVLAVPSSAPSMRASTIC